MPTPLQFRTLVDQTLQTTRLLLHSYRMPGAHPSSAIEQETFEHVMTVLQQAYAEVFRLLAPEPRHRGGSHGTNQAPETSPGPGATEAEIAGSTATRRARP